MKKYLILLAMLLVAVANYAESPLIMWKPPKKRIELLTL